MRIKKFRPVAIVAHDLGKLIDFYTQTLGFEVKRRYEARNANFQNGIGVPGADAIVVHLTIPNSTVELEMFQFNAPVIDAYGSPLPVPANQPGFRHMALIVDDLQAAYLELKAKGIIFLSEPITHKEPKEVAGFQFVYFRDPEGNIVELNQLPDWA
jgi:catechol 2,3-dioxygenase-like lactoylglutathione lyase family enzyme